MQHPQRRLDKVHRVCYLACLRKQDIGDVQYNRLCLFRLLVHSVPFAP